MAQSTFVSLQAGTRSQIDSATVSNSTSTNVYNIVTKDTNDTSRSKTIAFTVGSEGSNAAVATAIGENFNAWTQSSPYVIVPKVVVNGAAVQVVSPAGIPQSVSFTNSAGGTWTGSTVQVNIGPNDFQCPANYAEGVIPSAGDTLEIRTDRPILYNLDYDAVALAGVTISGSGNIGAPGDPLRLDCTSLKFLATGGKSYINTSIAAAGTLDVLVDSPNGWLHLQGEDLDVVEVVNGSKCEVAMLLGSTATVATIQVSGKKTVCNVGVGANPTTINVNCGTTTLHCGATTTNINDGIVTSYDDTDGTTTVNVMGGTFVPNGTATIAAIYITKNGKLDLGQTRKLRTITLIRNMSGNPKAITGFDAATCATSLESGAPLEPQ